MARQPPAQLPANFVARFGGQKIENMLFGDGHVEFCRFPDAMDGWGYTPVDIEFLWW